MLDTHDVEDAELLEIADTLVSLRDPPSQLPPPLPAQPPPDSATYPQRGLGSISGFRDTYLGRQVVSRPGGPRAGIGSAGGLGAL